MEQDAAVEKPLSHGPEIPMVTDKELWGRTAPFTMGDEEAAAKGLPQEREENLRGILSRLVIASRWYFADILLLGVSEEFLRIGRAAINVASESVAHDPGIVAPQISVRGSSFLSLMLDVPEFLRLQLRRGLDPVASLKSRVITCTRSRASCLGAFRRRMRLILVFTGIIKYT